MLADLAQAPHTPRAGAAAAPGAGGSSDPALGSTVGNVTIHNRCSRQRASLRTTDNVPRAFPPRRSRPGRRPTRERSRFGRIFRRVLVVLLLVPLVAYAILPLALRFIAPEMLAARGLPATVSWGYLDLWKLELVLSDLRVGPESGPAIAFAEFRASFVRGALAQGRIELTDLRLRGASFDIDDLSTARLPVDGDAVPFEQVQLNDLRLSGLSEKLGRDVVVRHALLMREGGEAGKGLRIEIDADAGGAPVEIRGALREEGDVQTLDGTLNASGVPARLLGPSGPDSLSNWTGSIYAATEFELRFEGPSAQTRLKAIGSLHTAALGLRLADLELTEIDSIWEGTLTLSGPAFGAPERVYFKGTLDAQRARVGSAGGPSSALLSGLHWTGIGGWHGVPVAAGEGGVDSVEFSGTLGGTGPVRADAGRVRLKATLDDAGRYRMDELRIRNLRAEAPEHGREVRVESLEALDLHFVPDGIRADRLAATTLEAVVESETGPLSWLMERPVLNGVASTPGGGSEVDVATLEGLRLSGASFDVSALGARVEGIQFDPQGRIDIDLGALDLLAHLADEGREVRVRELRTESLSVGPDGAWEAASLSADRISRSGGEAESWAAQGLRAESVRHQSGETAAGDALLESLTYRGESGSALEGTGLHARSLQLRSERGQAGSLEAESIRYRIPGGASWDARALAFTEAQWLDDGLRSAARSASAELRVRSSGGERWRFDSLELGSATLRADGAVRIENAGFRRTALQLSSGEALEAFGVRSGPAERDAAGTFGLSKLKVESLDSRALSGLAWRAVPMEMESLTIRVDGQVEARRLRSPSMSLHDGQGGRWQASGIEARRLDWHLLRQHLEADPLELERLEFAAADGVTWGADKLHASGLDWTPDRAPRIRRAAASALEGATATGLSWKLEDLEATGGNIAASQASRVESLRASAGHLETPSGDSGVAWSGLRASGLDIGDAEHFGAERVVLDDLLLSREPGSPASLAATRVEIGGLQFEGERLAAERVTMDESVVTLGVNETGKWLLPAWPAAPSANTPLALAIGELETGGHNRVTFVDRSAEPPFEIAIEPYRLRVTGLDDLVPQHAAFLEIDGTLDASGRLEVRGELYPSPNGFDVQARVRLDGLELGRLSDYARRRLGVAIRSGRGDVDLDVRLSGGNLDATGDLGVRNLELEAEPSAGVAGESLAEGMRRLAAPGGRFELHVSVQGPIADPDFDFPAAAGRAIAQGAGLDSAAGAIEAESSSDN